MSGSSLIRRCLAAVALSFVATTTSAGPRVTRPEPQALAQRLAPEVRLRKLHLVRPDLIPYPISYEVYC